MKKIILVILFTWMISPFAWATFPFPTTSILDSFNRANESPLSNGGTWTQYGSTYMKIVSDKAVGNSASGTYNGDYWNVYTFKNPEAYVTIASTLVTSGDSFALFCDFNTSSSSGYEVQYIKGFYGGVDGLFIQKLVNGSSTTLAAIQQNVNAGDSIGISHINGQVNMWYEPSGTSNYLLLAHVTDSTYSTGNIGMITYYSTTSPGLTNFGGGNQQPVPLISAPYTCSTNYYVSTTGNDSHAGTSTGTAWLTINGAMNNLVTLGLSEPGVCVNVAPGTYSGYMSDTNTATLGLTGTGSGSGMLTFRCTTYHQCILQMPQADATGYNAEMSFGGTPGGNLSQYITVDSFDFEGAAGSYFALSSAKTATGGAVYSTANGNLFTVQTTLSAGTTLVTTGTTGIPNASGNLTNVSCPSGGTCNSPIAYTSVSPAIDTGLISPGSNSIYQVSHIWAINNIFNNFGAGGFGLNHADYITFEGNVVTNNASTSQLAQTSGFSTYQMWASDFNAGTHNTVKWNLFYGNGEGPTIPSGHSDGNAIIIDDPNNSQSWCSAAPTLTLTTSAGAISSATASGGVGCNVGNVFLVTKSGGSGGEMIVETVSSGNPTAMLVYLPGSGYTNGSASVSSAYTGSTLIEDNMTYNDGGAGIHIFSSTDPVSVTQNTSYNDYTDQLNTSTSGRGVIDASDASNVTFVNNIAVAVPGSGTTVDTIACGDYSFASVENTGNSWYNNICYNNSPGATSTQLIFTTSVINGTTFNILGVNPGFASISEGDFTLDSSYPAKGAGTSAYGYPATDIIGKTVNSNNITIGAYQFLTTDQNGTTYY